jgi:hypothetical protein
MNRTCIILMATLGLATSLCAAEPWTMHKIDNAMYNHNSLSPGDVNGDGYTDYAVIHEGTGKYTFQFSDVDGDGDEDIINCNADWNSLPDDL